MKKLKRQFDVFHFLVLQGLVVFPGVAWYGVATGEIIKDPLNYYPALIFFSFLTALVAQECLLLRLSYNDNMVELRAGSGWISTGYYRIQYEDIDHLELCLPRSFKDAFSISQSKYQIVIKDRNNTKPIDYIDFPPGQIRIVLSRFVAESSIDFLETLARARPDLQTKIDTMIEEILANRMVINWKRY
jgi:hypothetical protein